MKLSEIAHKYLGITTQTASYYLEGLAGYPNLGLGLNVEKVGSYHSWELSEKDSLEFIERIERYRSKPK